WKIGTSSSHSSRRITSLPSSGIVASFPLVPQHVEHHPVKRLAAAQPDAPDRAILCKTEPPGEVACRLVPACAPARCRAGRQGIEDVLHEQARALRSIALPPVLRVDDDVDVRGEWVP